LGVVEGGKGGQVRVKTDFILAITQLAAERNLPKDVVFSAVEAALVSAFKKDDLGAQHNISVKINPASGDVKVYTLKTAVEKPTDVYREISLAEAQKIKKDIKLGETISLESTQFHAGRIAAQTAKQVVLQRLREAEREFIFGEYVDREGGWSRDRLLSTWAKLRVYSLLLSRCGRSVIVWGKGSNCTCWR
jgi:N utilization substance protein A